MKKEPIRIFIGTEDKTKIPFDVLSYSIKRHTSHDVVITPMIGKEWEVPTGLRQGTGFSLRRFMIPKFCDFEGFAIYLDADQLVFGDISELWGYSNSMGDKSIACTYCSDKFCPKSECAQTSVMLINCETCGWVPEELWNVLKNGHEYHSFMHLGFMKSTPFKIPSYWNSLNKFEDDTTRLIHYTKEPEQPWYKPGHPFAIVWQKELSSAIAKKAVARSDFEYALSLWNAPRIDNRPHQGLNPFYDKYLKEFT